MAIASPSVPTWPCRRDREVPDQAKNGQNEYGIACRNVHGRCHCAAVIFSFHEYSADGDHEDHRSRDEPVQAHGNGIISGYCSSSRSSLLLQLYMGKRASNLRRHMTAFLGRAMDLNQAVVMRTTGEWHVANRTQTISWLHHE